MNLKRHYLILAGVALVVMLLTVSGCKFMSLFNSHSDSSNDIQPVAQITTMPRVTMTDVDAAGRKLVSEGFVVTVKRQEMAIPHKGRSGSESYVLPEVVRTFKPSQWNHMVAAQDPPPGAPVRPGSVVILTAGVHHGAGPFRPWVDAHGGSVKIRGEQRCRDCHPPTYCSKCHDKVLPRGNS